MPRTSIRVFISYSHDDQELYKKLEKHLSPLLQSRTITIWHGQDLPVGSTWEDDIRRLTKESQLFFNADIILFLVSAHFVASGYPWRMELPEALKLHEAGTARIIPILLRPVLWKNTPLGQFQALPTGAKPITLWDDQDAAFEDVVRGISQVIEDLQCSK